MAGPVPAALPTPPTSLIGRTDELAAVLTMLAEPGTRLVTVTGPPGVGKTRLALAAARGAARRFAAGAAWLDLAPLRDPGGVLPEILAILDGALPGRRRTVDSVTDRDLLLVLDNCEHLMDAVPDLAAVLARTDRLQVLATSRQRLQLAAEREFPLPPLPTPDAAELTDLERLARNPAVALLLARAPRHIALTPHSAPPLVEVCRQLDGLPLALELAAARLRVFTPGELAFRLDRRMAVLTNGPRDAPNRHRDLRAAMTWSHDLLPESERLVFRRLAAMAGDWTLAAAEAVCGVAGVAEAIDSLLDKSLVRRTPDDGPVARFRMLAGLREFAAEQLAEHGEVAETAVRHARHFAGEARRWESALGTDDEAAAFEPLGAAHPDLQAALETSRRGTDAAQTLWLAAALGWYRYTRGSLSGRSMVLDAIGTALPHAADDWAATVAGLTAAGTLALGGGDLPRAAADLARAATLCDQHGDARRLAVASAFAGHVAREQGDLDAAAVRYETARRIFAERGVRGSSGWASHDLGLLAAERGDPAAAEVPLREALRLFRDLSYDWAIAVSATALGAVLCRNGAIDEPAALFAEALAVHDRLGDQRGTAQCLEGIAQVAVARGAAATAARLRGAALAGRNAVGARPTDFEEAGLTALDDGVLRLLGRAAADRERHSGQAMPLAAAARLAREVVAGAPPDAAPDVALTRRQREVAALVAASSTNRQIARALGISEKTAELHVRNIMARLAAPNRAGVAAWAVAHGLRAHAGGD